MTGLTPVDTGRLAALRAGDERAFAELGEDSLTPAARDHPLEAFRGWNRSTPE